MNILVRCNNLICSILSHLLLCRCHFIKEKIWGFFCKKISFKWLIIFLWSYRCLFINIIFGRKILKISLRFKKFYFHINLLIFCLINVLMTFKICFLKWFYISLFLFLRLVSFFCYFSIVFFRNFLKRQFLSCFLF